MAVSNCGIFTPTILLLLVIALFYGTQGDVRIIEPVDESVNVAEGSDAIFECRHLSSESVEWSLNGLRILNSSLDPQRFQVSRSDEDDGHSISTLTVRSVTPADRGEYKCSNADTAKALFEPETETDSVEVKIIKRLNIALTIYGPENGRVVAGRDLWLTCTGHSSSDVVWYFGGDVLHEGDDVTIQERLHDKTGEKDSVLTVDEVASDSQGRYRCYDRVNGGEASIDIQVTEQVDVRIIEPVDESVNVAEGSDAIFKCRHLSSESVEWSFNGLRILNSSLDPQRFQVSRSDEDDGHSISTLTVRSVTPADRGEYKCSNADTAKALFEPVTETDSVEVKIIKRLNIALVIEGPKNGRVVAGRELRLTCRGHSSSDIVWYFNGHALYEGVDVTTEERRDANTGDKDSVLTVDEVGSDSQGRYRCYDRVNGGEASIDIQVTETDGVRLGAATSNGFRFHYTATVLLPIVFALIE